MNKEVNKKMVKLRNIKVSEDEDLNWDVKKIHFHLQNPDLFFNMIQDILSNAKNLGIKITLEANEQFLIKKYEEILNGKSGTFR